MVEFGNQIQGVQGDEPGEAVMLNDSGEIPSSGGMKWTRIPYNSTLETGKIYKVITVLGSAEFMPSSRIDRIHFVSSNVYNSNNGQKGFWRHVTVTSGLKLGILYDSIPGAKYESAVSENNCALFVLEE